MKRLKSIERYCSSGPITLHYNDSHMIGQVITEEYGPDGETVYPLLVKTEMLFVDTQNDAFYLRVWTLHKEGEDIFYKTEWQELTESEVVDKLRGRVLEQIKRTTNVQMLLRIGSWPKIATRGEGKVGSERCETTSSGCSE